MKRVLIGMLVAPLAYPLLIGAAMDFAFNLLASGSIMWSWHLPHMDLVGVGAGYLLMLVLFVPFVLVCRKFGRNALWVYIIGGFSLGFVGPFYLLAVGGGNITEMFASGGPWLVIPQALHFQTGSAIASTIVLGIFWVISVWRNSWFGTQPDPARNRTRADGARPG